MKNINVKGFAIRLKSEAKAALTNKSAMSVKTIALTLAGIIIIGVFVTQINANAANWVNQVWTQIWTWISQYIR